MKVGLSVMPCEDFLQASLELFAAGSVDVVEWSFDMAWGDYPIPTWCDELIDQYSRNNALLGHGVKLSPLSVRLSARQQQWLDSLAAECKQRNYIHISEHFGFMEAGPFQEAAPLPVPSTEQSVSAGRRMLRLLADTCHLPVGLENLAFAFCQQDVLDQGHFLRQLLEPVDGFLLLDLHNIYCQLENFSISADELLCSYPLDRVREIHLSGGSWSAAAQGPREKIRRDTHDGPVPDPLYPLLDQALKLCPNVQYVILERLGNTMDSAAEQEEFRQSYGRIRDIVSGAKVHR